MNRYQMTRFGLAALMIVTRLRRGNRSPTPRRCCVRSECPQNRPVEMSATSRCGSASKNTGVQAGAVVGSDQSGGAMSTRERAELSAHLTEKEQEARNIRRLQLMMSMVMSVISQDGNLTVEEASELAAGAKRAALAMFPDKELAYDILYKPRLQRLMNERFRLQ